VLNFSAEGLTDKEIATRLDVSLGTVHTYWTRIRSKCHGKTRAEIVGRHVRAEISRGEAESRPCLMDAFPLGVLELEGEAIRRMNRAAAIILGCPQNSLGDMRQVVERTPVRDHVLRIAQACQSSNVPEGSTTSHGFRFDAVPAGDNVIILISVPLSQVRPLWRRISLA